VHGWTSQSGECFNTVEQRIALAKMWEPKEQGTRTSRPFLDAWGKVYRRIKSKNPDLAGLMIDERAGSRCLNGNIVFSVPKPMLDYLKNNACDAVPFKDCAKGFPIKFMSYG